MDEKEQRMDEDRDDQKSGRPVQLDKDKPGQQQGGGQQGNVVDAEFEER